MSDIGIENLKPNYEKTLLRAADTAYWEVLYEDGTVLCESQGAKYPQIDRSHLKSFRIVYNGEIVLEAFPPPGVSGHNLVYRRRSILGSGSRGVLIILGWAPMGPIFGIDLDNGSYYEDAMGIMPTLTPMPGEPDDLLLIPKG